MKRQPVYVATFARPLPYAVDASLIFEALNMRFAKDHAAHVAWQADNRVISVRRATPDETAQFRKQTYS